MEFSFFRMSIIQPTIQPTHPVIEADDGSLLNVAPGEQSLPCPEDPALCNLYTWDVQLSFEGKIKRK